MIDDRRDSSVVFRGNSAFVESGEHRRGGVDLNGGGDNGTPRNVATTLHTLPGANGAPLPHPHAIRLTLVPLPPSLRGGGGNEGATTTRAANRRRSKAVGSTSSPVRSQRGGGISNGEVVVVVLGGTSNRQQPPHAEAPAEVCVHRSSAVDAYLKPRYAQDAAAADTAVQPSKSNPLRHVATRRASYSSTMDGTMSASAAATTTTSTGATAPDLGVPVVTAMCYDPDSMVLVTGDEKGYLACWDVRNIVLYAKRLLWKQSRGAAAAAAALSKQQQRPHAFPDGNASPLAAALLTAAAVVPPKSPSHRPPPAIVGGRGTNTAAVDAQLAHELLLSAKLVPKVLAYWHGHDDDVTSLALAFGPCGGGGNVVASCGSDLSVHLWSLDGVSLGNFAQGRILGEQLSPGVLPFRTENPPPEAWQLLAEEHRAPHFLADDDSWAADASPFSPAVLSPADGGRQPPPVTLAGGRRKSGPLTPYLLDLQPPGAALPPPPGSPKSGAKVLPSSQRVPPPPPQAVGVVTFEDTTGGAAGGGGSPLSGLGQVNSDSQFFITELESRQTATGGGPSRPFGLTSEIDFGSGPQVNPAADHYRLGWNSRRSSSDAPGSHWGPDDLPRRFQGLVNADHIVFDPMKARKVPRLEHAFQHSSPRGVEKFQGSRRQPLEPSSLGTTVGDAAAATSTSLVPMLPAIFLVGIPSAAAAASSPSLTARTAGGGSFQDVASIGHFSQATRAYLRKLGFEDNPRETMEQRRFRVDGAIVLRRSPATTPSAAAEGTVGGVVSPLLQMSMRSSGVTTTALLPPSGIAKTSSSSQLFQPTLQTARPPPKMQDPEPSIRRL